MASFEMPVSRSKSVLKSEVDEPQAVLTLGTFRGIPKVHFQEVFLGRAKTRVLIIENPTDQICFLNFLKRPSSAFTLSQDSDKDDPFIIAGRDSIRLDIEWRPKELGPCFESFQLKPSFGGLRLSVAVHLLGKCLLPLPPLPPRGHRGPSKAKRPTKLLFPRGSPSRGRLLLLQGEDHRDSMGIKSVSEVLLQPELRHKEAEDSCSSNSAALEAHFGGQAKGTRLMTRITQLLKSGLTEEEVLALFIGKTDELVPEIWALYTEQQPRQDMNFHECLQELNAVRLSKSFCHFREILNSAIDAGRVRLRSGVNAWSPAFRSELITLLTSAFSRPWLSSALSLLSSGSAIALRGEVFNVERVVQDYLFGYEHVDEQQVFPLVKYLEIVFLLDGTAIPCVYTPNYSTVICLNRLASYLETDLIEIFQHASIQIKENVDPLQLLAQDFNAPPSEVLALKIVSGFVSELVRAADLKSLSREEDAAGPLFTERSLCRNEGLQFHSPELLCDSGRCLERIGETLLWSMLLKLRIAQCKFLLREKK